MTRTSGLSALTDNWSSELHHRSPRAHQTSFVIADKSQVDKTEQVRAVKNGFEASSVEWPRCNLVVGDYQTRESFCPRILLLSQLHRGVSGSNNASIKRRRGLAGSECSAACSKLPVVEHLHRFLCSPVRFTVIHLSHKPRAPFGR